jgi:hypothetical protein
MFKLLDDWIEKKLKKSLHKKREKYIEQALDKFKNSHPNTNTDELLEKLKIEADRFYALVDRSVLRSKIRIAKYIFWGTLIFATLLLVAVSVPAFGTPAFLIVAVAFVSPPILALFDYIIAIATIPTGYNQLVKGALDATVLSYEHSLKNPQNPQLANNNAAAIIQALNEFIKKNGTVEIALDPISQELVLNKPERLSIKSGDLSGLSPTPNVITEKSPPRTPYSLDKNIPTVYAKTRL